MRINAEQFAEILGLVSGGNHASSQRDESLKITVIHWANATKEVESRLAAIEQGQGVLLERLDHMLNGGDEPDRIDANHLEMTQQIDLMGTVMASFQAKLDSIQGALLLQQFKANAKGATKPCRAKKQKRRK